MSLTKNEAETGASEGGSRVPGVTGKTTRKRNVTTSIPVGTSDDDYLVLHSNYITDDVVAAAEEEEDESNNNASGDAAVKLPATINAAVKTATPIKNFGGSKPAVTSPTLFNDGKLDTIKSKLSMADIPQATTTLRTAAVFFFVGFIWHSTILPFFYKQVGPEIASLIQLSGSHVDAFRDPPNLDPKVLREFGLAGAASHTIVFMFGFICATALRTLRFSSIVRSQGGRWEPIGIGVSLVLVVWTAAVFHVIAQAFCRYAFETKFGPVYNYAMLFYEETNGKTPFAWASSVSFTTALMLGFLISTDFHMTRFEKVVMFPLRLTRASSLSVIIPFAIWIGLLDSVLIPFSQLLFSRTFTFISAEDMVTGSHAFAFAVGLMMMFVGQQTRIRVSSAKTARGKIAAMARRCCDDETLTSEAEEEEQQQQQARKLANRTFNPSNVLHVFQATTMTLLLSATLLASALFNSRGAEQLVSIEGLWRPVGLALFFALGWYVTSEYISKIQSSDLVDYVIDKRYPRRRRFFTYMVLIALWNCYLFPFFGCWAPFHLFAFVASPNVNYTQYDAAWDGFLYAFTGPYAGPVIIQGMIKYFTGKMKMKWGLLQETALAVLILVPPTLTVWIRWHQNHVALPIYFFMSLLELLYLLTWRNRPEYSGWRTWPELKESRLWMLIEDYFQVRLIVDGQIDTDKPDSVVTPPPSLAGNMPSIHPQKDTGETTKNEAANKANGNAHHVLAGFEPNRPRIIGFHPHGLFPCTVVWMHLIPLWRKVFGPKLTASSLTDSFTHVPPGMREVMQWAGGREITKGVMNALLQDGSTCIIVPGGQNELMMHSNDNFHAKRMILCAKHRGFLRVAMENRASLVPVFSFGELVAIKNIEVPLMQRISRKIIGFPIPFMPVGVGGILPIPKETKITLVYGQPIDYFCDKDRTYTEDDIEFIHKAYFASVRNLFEKYKDEAGFGDWKLILSGVDDHTEGESFSNSSRSHMKKNGQKVSE